MRRDPQKRSNSTTAIQQRDVEAAVGEIWPGRLPSPLLVSDFAFREELLIEHYFRYHFKRQFKNNSLPGSDLPNVESIRQLILSNPALRHSACALAAVTFPSHRPPSQREILAHLGMALTYLRKIVEERKFDESVLLAIIELVDFEVSLSMFIGNGSGRQDMTEIGKSISTPRCLSF